MIGSGHSPRVSPSQKYWRRPVKDAAMANTLRAKAPEDVSAGTIAQNARKFKAFWKADAVRIAYPCTIDPEK
jgi:hypothetical protein